MAVERELWGRPSERNQAKRPRKQMRIPPNPFSLQNPCGSKCPSVCLWSSFSQYQHVKCSQRLLPKRCLSKTYASELFFPATKRETFRPRLLLGSMPHRRVAKRQDDTAKCLSP